MTDQMMQEDEILQLDFEGVEAQDSDVPSLSRLLNQLVKESGVDPDQLAKVLVSQNYVGSVLKPCIDDVDFDDGEDPEDQAVYAVTTVVNVTQRKDPVIKDVIRFLKKHIRELGTQVEKAPDAFDEFLDETSPPKNKSLGLLIKERMINMPVQLLHPSLLSLVSDMDRASKRSMPYKFTHLLYWSKMYLHDGQCHHIDLEDSWFDENATAYFNYPLKFSDTVMVQSGEEAVGAVPTRRVYIFEFPKLNSFIEHVKQVSGQ